MLVWTPWVFSLWLLTDPVLCHRRGPTLRVPRGICLDVSGRNPVICDACRSVWSWTVTYQMVLCSWLWYAIPSFSHFVGTFTFDVVRYCLYFERRAFTDCRISKSYLLENLAELQVKWHMKAVIAMELLLRLIWHLMLLVVNSIYLAIDIMYIYCHYYSSACLNDLL